MAAVSINSAAVSTDGQTAIQTTKVSNSIQGQKELMITFTNTTGAAQTVTIKSGAHRYSISATAGASEFVSSGFANNQELQAYLKEISTVSDGFRAYSDVPGNFDGYLEFTEKEPDGTEMPVKFYLQKYKMPLGGGTYANEINVPSSDIRINLWAALEVAFKTLKANSFVTFYFPVKGWNKSNELSKLKSSSIS